MDKKRRQDPEGARSVTTGSQDRTSRANAGTEPAEAPDTRGSLPALSLPKGGGAIRGIGEKFAANPVTGTGSLTVPIPTSPGRGGFGPELSLSYDSASGNGPFGFGWTLVLAAITRKTEKGLPSYADAEESDVFVLSGHEDLVPVLKNDGTRYEDRVTAPGFTIHRYRPRIDSLFARIERWTERATGDVHWRSITKDNVTTLYGRDADSRVFDPGDPSRIFSWLICTSYDDKGNAIVYEYVHEDAARVDRSQANERNRVRTANRYLKRIHYGNRVSRLVEPDLTKADWLFEVVFDYGEGHYEEVALDPGRPEADQRRFVRASVSASAAWSVRPDPFSSYRSGFEVRTYRRCSRVLMFHRFAALGAQPCLVQSTELDYADFDYTKPAAVDAELAHPGSTRIASFVRSITRSGYVRDPSAAVVSADGAEYVTYRKASLPPLEFEYSKARIEGEIRTLQGGADNLPAGIDGVSYQLIDLDGEGISGALTRQAGAWFYKENLGGGRLGPAEVLAMQPSLFAFAGAGDQFVDLSGDGQLDIASFGRHAPGFFERTPDGAWNPFRPFRELPNVKWNDPNLRFVDLDGDGHADILITEDDAFTWYPSLAEEGFAAARRVRLPHDEETGPRLVLADGTQSIYLADLSGDGLTDLVRVRNGEVCYWPNLGYGRFGAKVTMDGAPRFDRPDAFDQQRIRLIDIDGSGTTDIIYLGADGVRLYFNQSGNRWSEARRLPFPAIDDVSSVIAADLLGNGTACLVWSSPLPAAARCPLRYVDLVGGVKPHLLVGSVNNLGSETRVEYAPSTKFYLADKRAGKPWLTRIPFPVHVIERVTTYDRVSGNRFVSSYAYHHGYFDGVEREFRGFGMVEQLDTEEFGTLSAGGVLAGATNLDPASHVPPVLTKTWFHTGVYLGRDRVSNFFAGLLDDQDEGEYFREPALSDVEARLLLLPDTPLPLELTVDEEREACRALKGMTLRREVYGLDGTDRAAIPYSVTEQNFTVEPLQRRFVNRHAVFLAHAREVIEYNYERNPEDPRVSHALTLEVDEYGNVLRSLAVGYGRRVPSADPDLSVEDRDKQARTVVSYTTNTVTNAVSTAEHYRAPLPAETSTFELTGFSPQGGAARFSFEEWSDGGFALLASAAEIPYEQTPNAALKQKRCVRCIRTLYRKDDLTGLCALGSLESRAFPGETYKLSLTPTLIAQVFKRKRPGQPDEDLLPAPAALLEGTGPDQGGYVLWDGKWWAPSGKVFFSPGADPANPAATAAAELASASQHFFVVRKVVDPFGQPAQVDYDLSDLLVTRTRDAVGNAIVAANDYRVLLPRLVVDPNRNRTAAAFDALGMLVASAIMGKEEESLGDLLEGFDPDPPSSAVRAFVADPHGQAASLLGKASARTVYDVDRYRRTGEPAMTATLARETHFQDEAGVPAKIQIAFSYSDGFAREIQKKAQAQPGMAAERLPPAALPGGDVGPGALVRDAQGHPVMASAARRWIGSGRTVFNNKGKPIKQYEPFFSSTHLYESESDMTDTGVTPVWFYDPAERVVATLYASGTYEKVVFDPWRQRTYDVNDTVASRGSQTGDPRTDPDISGYVSKFFEAQPPGWQTWYERRIGGGLGPAERDAALKAAAHADTPTDVHFDTLGRPFMTVARNRYERASVLVEESDVTRVTLDIEGNQLAVRDAKDRVVMRYDYDLMGRRIHQSSMDGGGRWTLGDALGNPVRAWDDRLFLRRLSYDPLRRLVGLYVTESGVERLAERTIFGEARGDAANHRTRVYQSFDAAGVATSIAYDFKGNLVQARRELLPDYKTAVDWQLNPTPNDGSFTSSTAYDALNRLVSATSPDGSVHRVTFNEAGLLEKVDVNLRGGNVTHFVTDVDYDAKGRRERITYGNGVVTAYEYDVSTFRLIHLRTTRPSVSDTTASQLFNDPNVLQDLRYTHDPIGNVTRIEDGALKTLFRGGQMIAPMAEYTYDALYRLIEARGREHVSQGGFDWNPPGGNYRDFPFVGNRAHPNDLRAFRNYTERYEYDIAGNVEVFRHVAAGAGFTRQYAYDEESLLEVGKDGNRLTSTTVGNGLNHVEAYTYDAHGNVTSMPHLASMEWDFRDQLQKSDLGGGGTAYYTYDAAGQRVRKVIETQQGARQKQRLYLGGFEIYREYAGDGAAIDLERESLHVFDGETRIALAETLTSEAGNRIVEPEPSLRCQLGNHLGSASAEVDGDGALISYEEYHPYGTTSFQAGRSSGEVSLKRYRYTGKERDEESGFAYHGRRYYAPWLARWTAADPKGVDAGPNAYKFVADNPIKFLDPDGKDVRLSVDQATHTITYSTTVHVFATKAEIKQLQPLAKDAERFFANPRIETDTETRARWALPAGAAPPAARQPTFTDATGTQWTVKFDVHYQFHDIAKTVPPFTYDTVGASAATAGAFVNNLAANEQTMKASFGYASGDNVMTMTPAAANVGGDTLLVSSPNAARPTFGDPESRMFSRVMRSSPFKRDQTRESLIHETGHLLGFDERYLGAGILSTTHNEFTFDMMGAALSRTEFTMHPVHIEEAGRFGVGVANGRTIKDQVLRAPIIDSTGTKGSISMVDSSGKANPAYAAQQKLVERELIPFFRSQVQPVAPPPPPPPPIVKPKGVSPSPP